MMEASIMKAWADFGLSGLIIGTLFACLYVIIKTQKEERQEWLEAYKEQCNRYDARQAETNLVLQSLSNVIHSSNNRFRDLDRG
jgi:hypothetical protein